MFLEAVCNSNLWTLDGPGYVPARDAGRLFAPPRSVMLGICPDRLQVTTMIRKRTRPQPHIRQKSLEVEEEPQEKQEQEDDVKPDGMSIGFLISLSYGSSDARERALMSRSLSRGMSRRRRSGLERLKRSRVG